MKVDPDFTLGFESLKARATNPFIWSSSCWMLFEAGLLWANRGSSAPVMARKSRGYTVKVQTAANDYLISFVGDDLTPELRRL
jgi:hypothetical protein